LFAIGAGGEDLDEVRMFDPAEGANLAREPGLGFRVSQSEKALQCYLPAQGRLPGPVHYSHATLAHPAQRLELADSAPRNARLGGHVRRLFRVALGLPSLGAVVADRAAEHTG
jgi:hypothetical protein